MLMALMSAPPGPAAPLRPEQHSMRNLFYEGAEMPLSPRMAEKLVGGQARGEGVEFQGRQRPVRDRWRGFEFGA
jgi:hypothetical protein